MELDDKLRARLRALAERDGSGLDEAARARVRARVLARQPGRGGAGWTLWLALPAAIALVAWLRLEPDRPALPAPRHAESSATPAPAPKPAKAAPDCARDPEDSRAVALGTLRAPELELARARVVQGSASLLAVEAYDHCTLGLSLARGEVAVHARSLRGGELWIESPLGRVRVRGTVFSVALERGRLRVAVAEGAVALSRGERELAQVVVDEVLELGPDGALARRALSERERARLLARLSLAPKHEQASGLQTAAPDAGAEERLWRGGAVPAFVPEEREAPSSVQPDGRPMQKPRLIE